MGTLFSSTTAEDVGEVTDTPPDKTGKPATAALSRRLSEFLLELSIGVHRYAMYPAGHPSLLHVAGNIIRQLGGILAGQRTLSLGVAREQLVIDGVATDARHPVLRDLAKRLHEHQLGGVSFREGVTAREVEGLLSTLAEEPERDGEPLGLLPRDELPSWAHIQIYPLGYDGLELKDQREGKGSELERPSHLWLGLARAAIASDDPEEIQPSTGAEDVARAIVTHGGEDAYDQVIVGYLLQLADELKGEKGGETESVRARVSSLIRELDESTLERLVRMGGSGTQRKQFVLDSNQSLAVDSVVRLLQAAASASEQNISHSLTRLLTKLSFHASSGTGRLKRQADSALRDNVDRLIRGWELDDPNPTEYRLILDSVSRAAPVFEPQSEGEGDAAVTGAHRLCQMALEVDAWGPMVERAVVELVEKGEMVRLLEMAESAPEGMGAREELSAFLANPFQLKRILTGAHVDEAALHALVSRMGGEAIPVLMEALAESEEREVRKQIFDILVGLGEDVGPAIMGHLEDPRWFVIRNMLALLQHLPEPPPGFTAAPFLEHEDQRVQKEALILAMNEPNLRKRALAQALSDSEDRILRMALLEVRDALPETLVPVLVNRVLRSNRPSALKAMGVRALENSPSPLALEVLLEIAAGGKSFLGRRKLASPSPETLSALRVLAGNWRLEPRAREVLELAQRSKESEVRRAVGKKEDEA